jgi:hypothetical protein
VISGIGPFLDAYLGQFAFHETMAPNHPHSMTGARNLLYELFGWRVSTLPLTLVAALGAFALGMAEGASADSRAVTLGTLLVLLCLLVPLHTYDMMLLAPLIILAARVAPGAQLLGAVGLLLVFRANNLAEVTGFFAPGTVLFVGSRIATIGVVLLSVAALLAMLLPVWSPIKPRDDATSARADSFPRS